MKLGDIKIEALKLMFADYVTDYRIEDIQSLIDDEVCNNYLVNMPGAINRAFSNLESRGVLPSRSIRLEPSLGNISGVFIRFDIPKLIADFADVDRVIYENERGEYEGNYNYFREGDTIVLKAPSDGEYYRLLYKPRIERITATTDDYSEPDIPEHISALIPYFIKGDLYRDDEPDEAGEARNFYEAGIAEMAVREDGTQNSIKTIYGMGAF